MSCLCRRSLQAGTHGGNPKLQGKNETVPGLINSRKEEFTMKFSLVPLLLASRDISAEARRALVENRLRDAAAILMEQNGLSCVEAGQLLDVPAC